MCISLKEIDTIVNTLELTSDGHINYKDFIRRMGDKYFFTFIK